MRYHASTNQLSSCSRDLQIHLEAANCNWIFLINLDFFEYFLKEILLPIFENHFLGYPLMAIHSLAYSIVNNHFFGNLDQLIIVKVCGYLPLMYFSCDCFRYYFDPNYLLTPNLSRNILHFSKHVQVILYFCLKTFYQIFKIPKEIAGVLWIGECFYSEMIEAANLGGATFG